MPQEQIFLEMGYTVQQARQFAAEAEARRVAVMDMGKIIALNSPEELIGEHFAETAVEFY